MIFLSLLFSLITSSKLFISLITSATRITPLSVTHPWFLKYLWSCLLKYSYESSLKSILNFLLSFFSSLFISSIDLIKECLHNVGIFNVYVPLKLYFCIIICSYSLVLLFVEFSKRVLISLKKSYRLLLMISYNEKVYFFIYYQDNYIYFYSCLSYRLLHILNFLWLSI